MERFKYLIIGGGMTADSAAQGIREVDREGRIGLLSAEPNPPYDRPPLSKALWRGDTRLGKIWKKTAEIAEVLTSKTVQRINPAKRQVWDDDGVGYSYDRLLLATGGRPRRLQNDLPDIIYYRTVEDYRILRRLAKGNREFGVIGGGFIGAEIAAALATKDRKVTMIFPEKGILGLIFPEKLSQFLSSNYEKRGVRVVANDKVASIEKVRDRIRVKTDEKDLEFDAVVAGIGISPNVELAYTAGLRVENGIIVDRYLRTSNPEIFAAGDVANFESPHLGKRTRVEHEDNANTMGRPPIDRL